MVAMPDQPDQEKHRCVVCGYMYVAALGDIEGDVDPGTPFDEIPDTWVCPICGVSKSLFRKET